VLNDAYTASGDLSQVTDNSSGLAYWTANSADAELQVTSETFGNGATQTQSFDPATGRLTGVTAGSNNGIANWQYSWDGVGNLLSRTDTIEGYSEYFCYDQLNRLTTYAIGSSCTASGATSIGYDALGDITSKSDVGTYAYPAAGQAHPHAFVARNSPPDCFVRLKAKRSSPSIAGTVNGVTNPSFAYDANGNMTSGAGRTISWTAFNMASQITQGARIIDQALEPQPGLEKEHRNHAWSPCRRALPCGAQQQLCGLKRGCCSQLFSHCRHDSPLPSIRRRLGPPLVAPLKTREAVRQAFQGLQLLDRHIRLVALGESMGKEAVASDSKQDSRSEPTGLPA
jgi:YD repeat-containing protein